MGPFAVTEMVDLVNATLNKFEKDKLQMTFAKVSNELFNTMFEEAPEDGEGDRLSWDLTLSDTGNAKMTGLFGEDSKNVKPTDTKGYANWVMGTTNVSFDVRAEAFNSGSEVRIYNELDGKIANMYREFGDMLNPLLLTTPISSADKMNPVGISGWLPLGTDDSEGGFTGYTACYNDGAGSTFYPDTITTSANVNPRNASYFADHNGKLGDNLINLIDSASISTHFKPARLPKNLANRVDWGNLRYLTNKKVKLNIIQQMRKNDDSIGMDLTKYQNEWVLNGSPLIYVDELDTANGYLWGTDPVYAINTMHIFLKCVKGWKFKLGKAVQDGDCVHAFTIPLDVMFAIGCNCRQQAGYLISQK
jgi:hypothetical protein